MKRIASNTLILMVAALCIACSNDKDRTIEDLHADAICQYHHKRFNKAIQTAEKALQKSKEKYGPGNISVAKSLDTLALFYNSVNDFSKAKSLYQESLSLKKAIAGKQGLSINKKSHPEQTFSGQRTEKEYPDIVPQEIKNNIIADYAAKNINLSELKPLAPVLMENSGIIFPYLFKEKEQGKPEKNIVLLFASIVNPDNKDKVIFKQSCIVTYQSFMEDMDKGGIERLKSEFAKIFPGLYTRDEAFPEN